MSEELKPCRNCGGKCDPTGWMCGDGRQGPECEGCGITTPDVESWNRLMSAELAEINGGGEAVSAVSGAPKEGYPDAEIAAWRESRNACSQLCSSPVVAEPVDVVAWLKEWRNGNEGGQHAGLSKTSLQGLKKSIGADAELISDEPLMKVEQHERIVTALTAPPASGAVPVNLRGFLEKVESLLACPQHHTRPEYIAAADELRALLAKGDL